MITLNDIDGIDVKRAGKQLTIRVPQGFNAPSPIVLGLTDAERSEDMQVEIQAGANSHATFIESWNANAKVSRFHYKTTVYAEPDSKIRLVTLQNLPGTASYEESRTSHVKKGADVHFVSIQLGAHDVKTMLLQNGIGESPVLNTDFIGNARNDQIIACTVKNHFHQKNGGGEINARGVARDKSTMEINGIIAIEQPAGGTNTFMHEHALLLSKDAVVKATPALEIDTNDVKASHGASVTNLSDDAIFYAKTRGLHEDDARTMMARGFLSDRLHVIDDLPDFKQEVIDLI